MPPPPPSHLCPGHLQGESCRTQQVLGHGFLLLVHVSPCPQHREIPGLKLFVLPFSFQKPKLQKQPVTFHFSNLSQICISLTTNEVNIFPHVCLLVVFPLWWIVCSCPVPGTYEFVRVFFFFYCNVINPLSYMEWGILYEIRIF